MLQCIVMQDTCVSKLKNYNKNKMFKIFPTILEVTFNVRNIFVV